MVAALRARPRAPTPPAGAPASRSAASRSAARATARRASATPTPVSYGIRRCEFDHYLLERCGAELRLGEPLRTLERRDGALGRERRRARADAGRRRRPLLSGGAAARRAARPRRAGRRGAGDRVRARRRSRRAPAASTPELPEIFFTRDLKGYGWVFRKGDYVNIGLGRQGNEKLAAHVAEFLALAGGARQGSRPSSAASCAAIPYLLYDAGAAPAGRRRRAADRRRRRARLSEERRGHPAGDRVGPARRADHRRGRAAATTPTRLAPYAQRIIERFGPRARRAEPARPAAGLDARRPRRPPVRHAAGSLAASSSTTGSSTPRSRRCNAGAPRGRADARLRR